MPTGGFANCVGLLTDRVGGGGAYCPEGFAVGACFGGGAYREAVALGTLGALDTDA